MERNSGWVWLFGAATGVAAMYYLDPRSGRRRRAMLRDKVIHVGHLADETVERLSADASNRARGAVARTQRKIVPEGPVEDERLRARVRSALGRLTTHPRAIEVEAHEGFITLKGEILAEELGDVITGTRRVPGVKHVESLLHAVQDPSGVPALQGGRPRQRPLPDLLQSEMSPTSRAVVGAAGGLLAWWGVNQGGVRGAGTALVGGLLLARAATNVEPTRLVTGRQPATVQRTVEILAPIDEVFAYWSNFRNFPKFMQHLREVRESDGGISQWVADGPAGVAVSWEAEITSLQPHRRIAWRSLPGSTVQNVGEVRFERVDDRHTRLHVRMTYNPPAGALGHVVATLFGADPGRQLDEDLGRFKKLLEDGSVEAHGKEVARQDVEPSTDGVIGEAQA